MEDYDKWNKVKKKINLKNNIIINAIKDDYKQTEIAKYLKLSTS